MTPHQYRIAKYRIDGWTGKEISDFLGIKPKTVFSHLEKLYRELDVHNVAQLTKKLRGYTNNNYQPSEVDSNNRNRRIA